MKKLIHVITRRLTVRYRKMSIHMVLSLAFTAVALVGVLFLGMSLLWRFSDRRKQPADLIAGQYEFGQLSQANDAGIRYLVLQCH
mgnify:CR=1 FL=1